MSPRYWLPPAVFLATAVPSVLLMHHFEIGGDLKIVIAIGIGAVATALVQSRMARQKNGGSGP
ncbi:MAG: hypothetical protein U1E89_08930 [Burkholderiaceae bacterium]